MFSSHIEQIKAKTDKCRQSYKQSYTILTAFLPYIGYGKATRLVKEFQESEGNDLEAFLKEKSGGNLVEKALSPASLVSLGYREGDQEVRKV